MSQKIRTFRIIILQADTSERPDSRRLESDLSEVSVYRMMIRKAHFLGHPVDLYILKTNSKKQCHSVQKVNSLCRTNNSEYIHIHVVVGMQLEQVLQRKPTKWQCFFFLKSSQRNIFQSPGDWAEIGECKQTNIRLTQLSLT